MNRMIGLNPEELSNPIFTDAMAGNVTLPGLDVAYATVYGCHSYGQWFGQLGDGRAMGIGEVLCTEETAELQHSDVVSRRYEIQLKGCGRTPFSRGFDGRAVLRSSIREFLGLKISFCTAGILRAVNIFFIHFQFWAFL